MPTWSEIRALIHRGLDNPVRASLTLWGEPDGSQYGWVMGGERIASLFLGPGDYGFLRDGAKRLVTGADGVPRLVDDGERVVVMSGDAPLEATGRLSLTSPANVLLSPDRLRVELDQVFPAGPVEETEHAGRKAWYVPGLPEQRYRGPEMPRSLVVDAVTGVVLKVENGDGGGELRDLECPGEVAAETFTWNAQRVAEHGEPRRPEAWTPPTVDSGCPDVGDADPGPQETGQSAVPAEWEDCVAAACTGRPEPVPAGHRVLRVVAGRLDDPYGALPDWQRGCTRNFFLGFVEAGDDGGVDEFDYSTVGDQHTVTAWAEPVIDGERVDQRRNGRGLRWQTVLRGDGWTALWTADRPVTGYVQFTGVFYAESDYARWFSPTRALVARVEVDVSVRRWDVAQDTLWTKRIDVSGVQDCPESMHDQWELCFDRSHLLLDLDAAEPPVPEEVEEPKGVHDFGLTCDEGVTALWRPEGGRLPAVWRTDLATGESCRVLLPRTVVRILPYFWQLTSEGETQLRVECSRREFLIDHDGTVGEAPPLVPSCPALDDLGDGPGAVRRHPDGGMMVLDARFGPEPGEGCVQRFGRMTDDGEIHWHEQVVLPEHRSTALLVAGERVFTGIDRILTVRDRNLDVVVRRRFPWDISAFDELGPWLGIDLRGRRGTDGALGDAYEVLDPGTWETVLTVDVSAELGHVRTYVRWFRGELWFADGRLRVFTPQADGSWTSREIALST